MAKKIVARTDVTVESSPTKVPAVYAMLGHDRCSRIILSMTKYSLNYLPTGVH
jgi:hypothetical protein